MLACAGNLLLSTGWPASERARARSQTKAHSQFCFRLLFVFDSLPPPPPLLLLLLLLLSLRLLFSVREKEAKDEKQIRASGASGRRAQDKFTFSGRVPFLSRNSPHKSPDRPAGKLALPPTLFLTHTRTHTHARNIQSRSCIKQVRLLKTERKRKTSNRKWQDCTK